MESLEARSPVDQLNELHSTLNDCVDTQKEQAALLQKLLTAKRRSTNQQAQKVWNENVEKVTKSHFQGLQNTVVQLNGLTGTLKQVKRQEALLRSLQFASIRRRHGDIQEAHERTLEWLFDEKGTSFVSWLENGRGVYWINGLVRYLHFVISVPTLCSPLSKTFNR